MVEIIRNLRDPRQVKFIENTINATTIKITLTDEEIEQAYREQCLHYHIEDIKSRLEDILTEYEDYPDDHQTTIGGIYTRVTVGDIRAKLNDTEWLRKTAERFDDALSDNGSFMDSFWMTAQRVIEEELEE